MLTIASPSVNVNSKVLNLEYRIFISNRCGEKQIRMLCQRFYFKLTHYRNRVKEASTCVKEDSAYMKEDSTCAKEDSTCAKERSTCVKERSTYAKERLSFAQVASK